MQILCGILLLGSVILSLQSPVVMILVLTIHITVVLLAYVLPFLASLINNLTKKDNFNV